MEVRLKIQTEGLNFLKVQKSLRAKSMNTCPKKISDENKSRLSNNEVFGFEYDFERKNVLHMNKDGPGINMVV